MRTAIENFKKFKELSPEGVKSFITKSPLKDLKGLASGVRRERFGDKIQLCSIINAKSGACSENCSFCAQSVHHKAKIERYSLLEPDRILEKVLSFEKSGVSNFGIVTSGDNATDKELDIICGVVESAAKKSKVKICASLGKLTLKQLKSLKSAGLDRYHHNLETSKSFFPKICSTHVYEGRVETILAAKEAGLKICSGGIFGVGESWENRAELASSLSELGVECAPINFLTPIPGTPLEKQPLLSVDEALRIIALYRLTLPNCSIRICGGRANVFSANQQAEIFAAGANAIMTGDYLTTSGISQEIDIDTIVKAGLEI